VGIRGVRRDRGACYFVWTDDFAIQRARALEVTSGYEYMDEKEEEVKLICLWGYHTSVNYTLRTSERIVL
jgi:hypothetical protein